jgi:hypothetical protein
MAGTASIKMPKFLPIGLQASGNTGHSSIVIAKKGFPILGELSRKEDNFNSTILYYFEVTQISERTATNW